MGTLKREAMLQTKQSGQVGQPSSVVEQIGNCWSLKKNSDYNPSQDITLLIYTHVYNFNLHTIVLLIYPVATLPNHSHPEHVNMSLASFPLHFYLKNKFFNFPNKGTK